MVTGFTLRQDGSGFLITVGDGLRIIMEDGGGLNITAGYGSPEVTGRLTGVYGGIIITTSAGIPFIRESDGAVIIADGTGIAS